MSNRAALFAAIEGGSSFWSNEISTRGADEVFSRLVGGAYPDRNSALKISERLLSIRGEEVLTEINSGGNFFITPEDVDWPLRLNDLSAIPLGLIGKGNRNYLLESAQSISIVGTRNPTSYGGRIAGDLAAGVVDRGWAVISGGAYGIDAAAHKGALVSEGVTIAILAGGTERSYPAANERLFRDIEEMGLMLSEVMPKVPPVPARFLIRNRLIAALSAGTVVVEAAFRSGSLRTAREAAEIFRPVMAVPGLITSPTSEGCHRLIGERCAELITCAADIFELVMPLTSK